jgi:hypothetical protein
MGREYAVFIALHYDELAPSSSNLVALGKLVEILEKVLKRPMFEELKHAFRHGGLRAVVELVRAKYGVAIILVLSPEISEGQERVVIEYRDP